MLLDRGKHQEQESVDDEGSWIISYADMITLLLAFFVLFFTIDPDVQTEEKIKSSLFVALNEQRSPASEIKVNDVEGHTGTQALEPIMDEMLTENFDLKAYKLGQRIVVDFPKTSFYSLGNIKLMPTGIDKLKEFVKIYIPYAGQYTLGIRAYTDSRKVKSNSLRYKDNLELSALRSVAAMRVLQKLGVPLDRMKLGGYGELKLTQQDLQGVNKTQRDPMSLARKVVLVIEPNEGIKK